MERGMVMVVSLALLETSMRENGLKVGCRAKVNKFLPMVISTKENVIRDKFMARVNLLTLMGTYSKESGLKD